MNIEDKQWTPEGKRLKDGSEFKFYAYYPGQVYPIHGAKLIKGDSYWHVNCLKESEFEEIPAPYSHIKVGDAGYAFTFNHGNDFEKEHFAGVDERGRPLVFINGGSFWTTISTRVVQKFLTIEEYNKLHGES